jgi:hypothetical protein
VSPLCNCVINGVISFNGHIQLCQIRVFLALVYLIQKKYQMVFQYLRIAYCFFEPKIRTSFLFNNKINSSNERRNAENTIHQLPTQNVVIVSTTHYSIVSWGGHVQWWLRPPIPPPRCYCHSLFNFPPSLIRFTVSVQFSLSIRIESTHFLCRLNVCNQQRYHGA